jgi:hypothetical protein
MYRDASHFTYLIGSQKSINIEQLQTALLNLYTRPGQEDTVIRDGTDPRIPDRKGVEALLEVGMD